MLKLQLLEMIDNKLVRVKSHYKKLFEIKTNYMKKKIIIINNLSLNRSE